jgi:hypothetical protein
VLRGSALGEGAGVFDEGVPGPGELAIEEQGGLAGDVAAVALRRPIGGEHARSRPVGGELARPTELRRGTVSVAGDGLRAARQGDVGDYREIEAL